MFSLRKNRNNLDDFEIDKQRFDELKDSALLIDVRDREEYQLLKKIPNTINVPYRTLIADPEKYISNKDQTVITICNAGHRSAAAAQSLREQGYKNSYVLSIGIYGYFH